MFNHGWPYCHKGQHFDLKLLKLNQCSSLHSQTNTEQSVSSNISHHSLRPPYTHCELCEKPSVKRPFHTMWSHWCLTLRSLTSLHHMFCPPLTAPSSPHSPSLGLRNHHAIQEAAGPSHVAINAISANMDSFARGRTAILKKQPSHMEAAHFGDLGTVRAHIHVSVFWFWC